MASAVNRKLLGRALAGKALTDEQPGYREVKHFNSKKATSSEHDLQVACVEWFRAAYPKQARLLFAIPNGGSRSKASGAKLKAEGMLRGVPDLMLVHASRGAHGMFVELKNGGSNNCSPEQKALLEQYTAEGYECWVIRSFWAFKDVVTAYMENRVQSGYM